ncbi:dephospho-CoA kinase [bacterium]|nr:MAG: dephospho-CoA kinase [bacterium]
MKRVGLTGSIATGKSLAASFFEELGVTVIDADLLARKVVEPGTPALGEIVKRFGPKVLLKDGSLDRAALGKLIFPDEKARSDLNAIIHPRVAREAELEFSRAFAADPDSFVVYNVPLLYETGMEKGFDLVVVVVASPSTQLERLTTRDGFTLFEARERIASQMDIFKKAGLAGAVLENEGSVEELRLQVAALAAAIRGHNDKTRKDLTNRHS